MCVCTNTKQCNVTLCLPFLMDHSVAILFSHTYFPCVVLCCVVLCCVVLCCVVLCCAVLCCVVLCCDVLCVVLCFLVLYCIVSKTGIIQNGIL